MHDDDLREGLNAAGFSKYQIQAYLALLDMGTAAATDLAKKANIPRSRIYDILRDLEEKGYVETFEQESLQARARNPEEVFERLKAKAETLEKTAEEIQNRWREAEVSGHKVSYVKRPETVYERAKTAIRNAENQIELSVTPEEYKDLRPVLQEAFQRGVFVTVSFNTSPERPRELPTEIDLQDVVTEARHRHLPAPFILIADRDVTCFTPHTDPVNQYGVLFEDDEMTYILRWYFKAALWESWPVVFSNRSDEVPLTYVDIRECIRDLIPLLDDGAVITGTVKGQTIEQREEIEISGLITDIIYPGDSVENDRLPTLSKLAGRAAIVMETENGDEIRIGGWGAILEHVEARRIIVESVEFRGE